VSGPNDPYIRKLYGYTVPGCGQKCPVSSVESTYLMREVPSLEKEIPSFPRLVVPCHKRRWEPEPHSLRSFGERTGAVRNHSWFCQKGALQPRTHALTHLQATPWSASYCGLAVASRFARGVYMLGRRGCVISGENQPSCLYCRRTRPRWRRANHPGAT
jgi:hypothetical protein